MRRSNLKHCKKRQSPAKLCSLIVSLAIAISAVIIPSTILIQNVHAVTLSDAKLNEVNAVVEPTDVTQETTNLQKNTKKKKVNKSTSSEVEAQDSTENATTISDAGYCPQYVELSDYDRDLLERLVTGEAASLGYEGCALVAQAVRDTMNMTGITSVEQIINEYKYTGSTDLKATNTAKKAVSDIFDKNGYAVNHRIIYFYAQDLVQSTWHETQNFVVSCANMRFFDEV